MNSLNLISSRVIGQSPPPRPRSRSSGDLLSKEFIDESVRGRTYSAEHVPTLSEKLQSRESDLKRSSPSEESQFEDQDDEKAPLLAADEQSALSEWDGGWRRIVKSIADAITALLAAIGAPVFYIAKCFRDKDGKFSLVPQSPPRDRATLGGPRTAIGVPSSTHDGQLSEKRTAGSGPFKLNHSYSSDSLTSLGSESDTDPHKTKQGSGAKVKSETPREESETRRSSIRIKEQSEAVKRRKQKKSTSPLADNAPLTVDNIKSPTSPSSSLRITRYPHAPQPPRPLTPRRQPSYSNLIPRSPSRMGQSYQQKTLILDLDETLIHSLAKGGRMSSGHMVEVKLNAPVALTAPLPGQATPVLGAHHPILYYVHKRPFCDEFLRKVSKWYKLVVFTASVQEYADPVVDWLEVERKYFAARYYRQHCTFRNGAYIKDLSSIEPDLSKVIILDNSPVSYIFHEDNAIPIEGWINDPTDNDLLHLIPMLEALQYTTDVRALLALRRGEAEENSQHN
ncbi:hypothetical protein B0A52_04988 [Exophiala mesophila]|uniref:FCP1 homology domain-containing protein n=1 Tax=Exophiala mesophila TaxID=212818 RepID=A0A438N6Y7_EXOME|nr:hypothetical protein B0A52_04988 [Exophiala mesophila]